MILIILTKPSYKEKKALLHDNCMFKVNDKMKLKCDKCLSINKPR